ncbi:thaumatin family-domain-containing protein [Thelonectria olida]|uniref:Thaumatin family-domain-containing protein n=1 Tax=Thelonectria olida TaxID=1576542 RepID=A0A9P8W2I0_9HYPO|nr:thaumatin family-domain-containing protein [Thelonectria olida]
MLFPSSRRRFSSVSFFCRLLLTALVAALLFDGVTAEIFPSLPRIPLAGIAKYGPRISVPKRDLDDSDNWDGKRPLIVTNRCGGTIWPGIATQNGAGPEVGGFELRDGKSRRLWVSSDWQGRVWGRTNCTVKGDSASCKTGDCVGKLNCQFSGDTPATLAEFNLAGGINNKQTFYDISLVDGYNLPIGIKHIPSKNTSFIPPNLTNCACIATPGWLYAESETGTYYANSTYPIPLETTIDNKRAARWCPWRYLTFPPTKPGDGIYPYPDDMIKRPDFSPCNSACATTGSDKDCCVGDYHDPDICRPSDYSYAAKRICPDAYSYAFDDGKSTFTIPNGGGWEVTICPKGRSTNILRQLGDEISELGNSGNLSDLAISRLKNLTYIEEERSAATGARPVMATLALAAMAGALMLL